MRKVHPSFACSTFHFKCKCKPVALAEMKKCRWAYIMFPTDSDFRFTLFVVVLVGVCVVFTSVKCFCCCQISSGNWKCLCTRPVLEDRPVNHLNVILTSCECFNYRYVYICRIFHKAYTSEITHTAGGRDCVFSSLILSSPRPLFSQLCPTFSTSKMTSSYCWYLSRANYVIRP